MSRCSLVSAEQTRERRTKKRTPTLAFLLIVHTIQGMLVQHTCHNCGKELEPPRTKWCSDRCRMRFKRQGSEAKPAPAVVVEAVVDGVVEDDTMEEVVGEPADVVVEAQEEFRELSTRKVVAIEQYNAVVAKNRELAVHVDLLVEERDKLTIQLGSTQDRLIAAERDAAANAARLEQIPRLENELSAERMSRRDAERSMSASDAKLEQMIRLEADLANERVAHADTKRKYIDASSKAAAVEDLGLTPQESALGLGSPISAGENARPGIKIAPAYRQSQLSSFVIILLLGVIIILAALVVRFVLGI